MSTQQDSFIMDKDKFKDFLKILNYFSEGCNDLHIVNKQVLQRTNDRITVINCDLSNLIEFHGELIFSDIKKIVRNLKELDKDSPIRFIRVGNSMRIKDTVTSIDIPAGDKVHIDNRKIPIAEFNQIFNFGQMILESELNKNLCESLNKFSKVTNYTCVTLSIQNKKAVLRYGDHDQKDISQEFNFKYRLMDETQDFKINIPIIAFNLKSATTLRVYLDQNSIGSNTIAYTFFDIPYNRNVTFEFYSRSAIIKEDENKREN